MTFNLDDLAQTAELKAQLTAALHDIGLQHPVDQILIEAHADVTDMVRGYEIAVDRMRKWVRIYALHHAYALAGAIPKPIADAYTEIKTELEAIAKGERKNLLPDDTTDTAKVGTWGSEDKIELRA
jgi:hypothetical protein